MVASATGHLILPGKPIKNLRPAIKPISINIPGGSKLMSMHMCELDIEGIPEQAQIAHIFPGLAHASLISISVLCDACCKVQYYEIR